MPYTYEPGLAVIAAVKSQKILKILKRLVWEIFGPGSCLLLKTKNN